MIGIDFVNVFYSEKRDTNNFNSLLFRLIAKADRDNMFKLKALYPREVALYEWWMSQPKIPSAETVKIKAAKLELQRA